MDVSTQSQPWGGYIGLFFLFLLIIGFGVAVIFYAKWLKYGPRFQQFKKNTRTWFKTKFDRNAPKIQKGAVIVNTNLETNLEAKIRTAKTPQELLNAQNEKKIHEQKVSKLEEELAKKAKEAELKKETKANLELEKKQHKMAQKEAKKKKKEQKKEEK